MTSEEKAREFINSDEIKEELGPVERMWLEQHIINLLNEYSAEVERLKALLQKKEEHIESLNVWNEEKATKIHSLESQLSSEKDKQVKFAEWVINEEWIPFEIPSVGVVGSWSHKKYETEGGGYSKFYTTTELLNSIEFQLYLRNIKVLEEGKAEGQQLIEQLQKEIAELKKFVNAGVNSGAELIEEIERLKAEVKLGNDAYNSCHSKEVNQQIQISNLQSELTEWKNKVRANLPTDCVMGYDEVKFCPNRLGDGDACKHCEHND